MRAFGISIVWPRAAAARRAGRWHATNVREANPMHPRHRTTVAAIAVLSATVPALLALSMSTASAGTGGGTLLCKTTTLAPPPQDAPLVVHVTANPSGPKAPAGAAIPVNNATVALTLPG